MAHVRDDFVGRLATADVCGEQFEIGIGFEADFQLDPAVDGGIVEHEDPRLRARAERQRKSLHLHIVAGRKPHVLEALAGRNGERHRLGELLPDGLQRVEVGVAPLLLLAGREWGGHARLFINRRNFLSRRFCRSGARSP